MNKNRPKDLGFEPRSLHSPMVFWVLGLSSPLSTSHSLAGQSRQRGDSASTRTSPIGKRGAGGLQEHREGSEGLSLGKGQMKDLALEGEKPWRRRFRGQYSDKEQSRVLKATH